MTLMVPPGTPGPNLHLIDHYGSLTMEQIHNWTISYLYGHNRHAQNSVMILECLSSTLTEGARQRVALRAADYTVPLPAGHPGPQLMDGLLYFKIIIMLATINTRATIITIRIRLSSLDTKIHEFDDNITSFNDYVKTQLAQLEARGQDTQDLLVNLFKAYSTVEDNKFLAYIEQRENEYNDGTDIDPVALMDLAHNKYATLVESGRWKQQTADQKKIVALTAQVAKFKKQALSHKTPKYNGNDDKKKKKGDIKKKKKKAIPKWKLENKNNLKSTTHNEKTYYWCPNHNEGKGMWTLHKPEDCEQNKDKEKQTSKSSEPKLQVKGMAAALSDDEDDDYFP